jgi:hypothetical protein
VKFGIYLWKNLRKATWPHTEEGKLLRKNNRKINDPPASLPRRLRVEPVDQFFGCRLLQLLRLEAAAWKRLPTRITKLPQVVTKARERHESPLQEKGTARSCAFSKTSYRTRPAHAALFLSPKFKR